MKRTIFITGATSGIGKACAERFAANGDRLILNGRRVDRLEELKTLLIDKYAVEILCASFDVQNKEEVFYHVSTFPEQWKKIDVLINNAGLAIGRDLFDEAHLEDWETMLQTNVHGLIYVSKAVLPYMIQSGSGHIINLGSIAGDEVYERGNIYCASKSAVEAISKAMRIDLLRHQIKVTTIKPGAAETEFSLVRFKGDVNEAAKTYTGIKPLSGEDIAETIFYCASLPAHVCINDLTITCTSQANAIYTFKKSSS